MVANTRMATAVQILCVVAYNGEAGTTSEIVARSLRTNPVVVRRLLKSMQRTGLVKIRPGKDGGVQLGRDPAAITLDQIHRAVEPETEVFALRPPGNPDCRIASSMNGLLTPVFGAVNQAVQQTLRHATLAGLMQTIS